MIGKISKTNKNSIRFSEKYRQLKHTNPEEYIEDLLRSGLEEQPGCVEFNIARKLGTSFRQVKEWVESSELFREAVECIKTSRTADLLEKLESGEIATTAADRLIYANCGRGFEPPKQSQALSATFDINNLSPGSLPKLLEITAENRPSQTDPV